MDINIVNLPQDEKKMFLEHELRVQDNKYDNTWKSCCITMDKRAVQYFTQMFIIGGIMVFNISQLLTLKDCNSQVPYMSLLTFLIGILIPNPKITR
jgi:hypothetical protein